MLSDLVGMDLCDKFPLVAGCQYESHNDLKEMYLNNVWRPHVAVTGTGGIPACDRAGNVLRPSTVLRISVRLSPVTDPRLALQVIL